MSPDCCTLINVSFTAQVPLRFYFRCRSLHSTVLRSLLHYVCLAIPIYLHFLEENCSQCYSTQRPWQNVSYRCTLLSNGYPSRSPRELRTQLSRTRTGNEQILLCAFHCAKNLRLSLNGRYFLSSTEYFQAIWQTLLICRLVVLTILSSSSLVNHQASTVKDVKIPTCKR